jgi:hypothetical protein
MPLTSPHRRLAAAYLALALLPGQALGQTSGQATDSPDQAQVRQVLMHSFDKPEARLQVEPIVVRGDFALAGWTQGERGGRAMLKRHGNAWQVHVCGGDGLKDPKVLQDAGLAARDASALAQALISQEAKLPAAVRAKFSSFNGLMRMDAHGQHPPH